MRKLHFNKLILIPVFLLIISILFSCSFNSKQVKAEEQTSEDITTYSTSIAQSYADKIYFLNPYRFEAENKENDSYIGSFAVSWWIPNEIFYPSDFEYALLAFPAGALNTYDLDDMYEVCQNEYQKTNLYYFLKISTDGMTEKNVSSANGGGFAGINVHGYTESSDKCSFSSISQKISFCFALKDVSTGEIGYTHIVTFSYDTVLSISETYTQVEYLNSLTNLAKACDERNKTIESLENENSNLRSELELLKSNSDNSNNSSIVSNLKSDKSKTILLISGGALFVCIVLYAIIKSKKNKR